MFQYFCFVNCQTHAINSLYVKKQKNYKKQIKKCAKGFESVKSTDTTNIKVLLDLAVVDEAAGDGGGVTRMQSPLPQRTRGPGPRHPVRFGFLYSFGSAVSTAHGDTCGYFSCVTIAVLCTAKSRCMRSQISCI